MNMYNRFRFESLWTLLAVILWSASSLYAQNETVQYGKGNIARDYCAGYNIKVYCKAPDGSVAYLYKFDILDTKLVDSAIFKKGKAVFKSVRSKEKNDVSKLIPRGFYQLVCDNRAYPFSIIINQQTSFNVYVKELVISFDNTSDNESLDLHWQERDIQNSDENVLLKTILMAESGANNAFEAVNKAAELTSTMPESFLGKYYRLNYEIMKTAQSDDPAIFFTFSAVPKEDYQRVISQVDFTDARYCHSSSMLFPFIEEYLTSDNRESTAEIITEVDTILVRAARGGRYQCGMYAHWLYNIFDRTGDPYYEPVMLHIYDTYDRGWIPEDQERRIKRQMDRIRKLAPGAQIPELTAYDINGKQHSTNEIQTKYTILWFWDPDCDHCQEMTPVLHDLYQEKADELDFEVFAVEVNDDYDRWTAFSEKHGLSDWINLSTSMGETSVDYIEYFDIVTTPVILLIDNEKNHVIIARQISLEEVERAMRR